MESVFCRFQRLSYCLAQIHTVKVHHVADVWSELCTESVIFHDDIHILNISLDLIDLFLRIEEVRKFGYSIETSSKVGKHIKNTLAGILVCRRNVIRNQFLAPESKVSVKLACRLDSNVDDFFCLFKKLCKACFSLSRIGHKSCRKVQYFKQVNQFCKLNILGLGNILKVIDIKDTCFRNHIQIGSRNGFTAVNSHYRIPGIDHCKEDNRHQCIRDFEPLIYVPVEGLLINITEVDYATGRQLIQHVDVILCILRMSNRNLSVVDQIETVKQVISHLILLSGKAIKTGTNYFRKVFDCDLCAELRIIGILGSKETVEADRRGKIHGLLEWSSDLVLAF